MILKMILLGFGSVGQGFTHVLNAKLNFLIGYYRVHPSIVAIVDRGGAAINVRSFDLVKAIEVKRAKKTIAGYPKCGKPGMTGLEVLESVEADVAIEATPTNIIDGEPGLSHIVEAMKTGKHVITSNKGPLALAFSRLHEAAKRHEIEFRYSATVGGATPIISLAKHCLAGNEIYSVRGILNATTNFILTKMTNELCPIDVAIKEAQKLGICEEKPAYDINGVDAACKIVILANALMDRNVTYRDLQKVEGIENIKIEDIEKARTGGCTIKLVGLADSKRLVVQPMYIPFGSHLCVDGTLNAVTLESDLAKEVTVIGRGAGPIETASTILNDLVDIIKVERKTLGKGMICAYEKQESSNNFVA